MNACLTPLPCVVEELLFCFFQSKAGVVRGQYVEIAVRPCNGNPQDICRIRSVVVSCVDQIVEIKNGSICSAVSDQAEWLTLKRTVSSAREIVVSNQSIREPVLVTGRLTRHFITKVNAAVSVIAGVSNTMPVVGTTVSRDVPQITFESTKVEARYTADADIYAGRTVDKYRLRRTGRINTIQFATSRNRKQKIGIVSSRNGFRTVRQSCDIGNSRPCCDCSNPHVGRRDGHWCQVDIIGSQHAGICPSQKTNKFNFKITLIQRATRTACHADTTLSALPICCRQVESGTDSARGKAEKSGIHRDLCDVLVTEVTTIQELDLKHCARLQVTHDLNIASGQRHDVVDESILNRCFGGRCRVNRICSPPHEGKRERTAVWDGS